MLYIDQGHSIQNQQSSRSACKCKLTQAYDGWRISRPKLPQAEDESSRVREAAKGEANTVESESNFIGGSPSKVHVINEGINKF